MPSVIVFIIILGIVVGVMTIFVVRSYLTPRKIAGIATLVRNGRTRTAIRLSKQILATDSRNCDLHYLLGRAYLTENKPELALMEFRTVNQLGAFSAVTPERDFRRLAADLYERFDYPDEALKEYLMLIKLESAESGHYYHAGLLFERRKHEDMAATYYRKALELDGMQADAHFRLGALLYRTGSPIEAKVELEAAVRAQPENYRAWFYLGRLMRDGRDYVGALSAFEKAQRDPETKVPALIERGSCYLQMNNLEKAEIDLGRAVRIAPATGSKEVLTARYFLAVCHEKNRKLDEAVEQWEKIYAKNPRFRDVGRKLSQYQPLRADDRMKDYLTSNEDGFQEICRKLVDSLGMRMRETSPFPNGCQILAVDGGANNRTSSSQPKLIRFFRAGEDISESTVRRLYEDMKSLRVHRSIIIASSNFTRRAVEFAETRPIELMGQERLQQMLSKTQT